MPVKTRHIKITQERNGVRVVSKNITEPYSAETLATWLAEISDKQVGKTYGDVSITGNALDEIRVQATCDEKRCVIYLIQVIWPKSIKLKLAVSGMWVHDAQTVYDYTLELAEKLMAKLA